MVDKEISDDKRHRNRRAKRAKYSPQELIWQFINWFRSPFPVWVQAVAAAVIAGLTFFIYQVTDEQRKIAKTSNVILGLQTAISEQQALIMKEQSKIMDATKLSQESADRAYIYFGRSIFSRDTGDGKIVVGVDVPIINSGNTPARQLKTLVDCAVHNGALTSDSFDLPRSQKNILESMYLGPKQTFPKLACILTQERLDDIDAGKAMAFVIGEAIYVDVFGDEPRKTHFAHRLFVVKKTNRYQFSTKPVGLHNCSDKDCP